MSTAAPAGTASAGFGRLEADFEDLPGHRSLVVRRWPAGPVRARAVFVPAFGDEMNQSRRMLRLAAEALAGQGIASTLFDLYGTGDSSAAFEDATVAHWLADCVAVAGLEQAASEVPLLLVGCRLGAALAVQASQALPEPAAALIAWAPVFQGKQQLSAMLRADKLGRMQRSDAPDGDEPRAQWASGRPASLGGYPISAVLAGQLEALDASASPRARRASLLDLKLSADGELVQPGAAVVARAEAWSGAGVPTEALAVAGASFWNVVDLVDVPELVDATVAAAVRVIEAS